MKDRTSLYPGRVRLVPVEGMADTYTMSWADEPLQEGTPLNKATLLSDTVAAALRLTGEDPTVSDAFMGIVNGFSRVTAASRSPDRADGGKAGDLWLDITNAGSHEYTLLICLGAGVGGDGIWSTFASYRKVLRTELIRTSGAWTVPGNLVGSARIVVYGAGGSGARHPSTSNASGGGGGGGYMNEWTGELVPYDVYSVTIGNGGAAVASTSGKAGGSTSFGTIVSAAGGSGASSTQGGKGGSGGGGSGVGEQFGSGGAPVKEGTPGRNTTSTETFPDAQGTGAGGAGGTESKQGGGGGGGYGGLGGNGIWGSGGGGGFGAYGNGGDGATKYNGGVAGSGGLGAGGGGCGVNSTPGAGGPGVCMITYYAMEVVA